MKILYAINSGKVGGAETHILELVKGLSSRHLITVVCPPGEMVAKYKEAHAMVVEDFPRFELDPFFMIRMLRLLSHNRFDVVHTHELMMEGNLMIPAFLLRVPVRVVHIHSPLPGWQTSPFKKALNLVANFLVANFLATKAIALMASIKKERVRGEGVWPSKVVVIPNGIDIKKFSRRSDWVEFRQNLKSKYCFPTESFLLGTLSRLTPEKGLDVFINALSLWRDQEHDSFENCHFFLAGDGPLRPSLEEQVRCLNLTAKVTFLGFVTDNPLYLQSLDLFVFPTLHEGFGYVLAEAMVAETLTLSSDLPVLRELTLEGRYGYHFAKGVSQELASRLSTVIKARQSFPEMVELAHQHISQNYSRERFWQRYELFYETELNK